ncbi:MAG: phosphoribosylamine--glycine ligase [Treponemataceae bacterium]|nr:phosphoribosylamine--glycine ligase [Treponemataceae bacterium]
MNIIVVGNGGREHAICWKLAQSLEVERIVCVPGNGGTAAEAKCTNIDIPRCGYLDKSASPYVQIAAHENCTLAVIGPEDPLAAGLADEFWNAGIPCVGPKAAAAQLEASKDFAKAFMRKHNVACAASETFTDAASAAAYVKAHGAPIVVKADGLAAGKGVVVAATEQDALAAIADIMESGRVGDAGRKIVLEDYLEGTEISVLAAVSVTESGGETNIIVPFLPARDHKRLYDGAKGPNTGGMGAVCPLQDVSAGDLARFRSAILEPTLNGLAAERFDYRGFLFFGVMLTADGPKLLEYNVRLGDPETQAVLPLMDADFAALCRAITDGSLAQFELKWKDGFQVSPVVVSGGYPGSYPKGRPISIDGRKAAQAGAKIFIAGAVQAADGGTGLVTSGGRVLACSAFGSTFDEAWKNAYAAVGAVHFDGQFFRTDIGLPGAAASGKL